MKCEHEANMGSYGSGILRQRLVAEYLIPALHWKNAAAERGQTSHDTAEEAALFAHQLSGAGR